MRKEQIANATLYLADCADVIEKVSADVIITDPPYGVEFSGKVTKHGKEKPEWLYEDTEENFRTLVLPRIRSYIEHVPRAAIFTGVRRMFEYPAPKDVGGIICPNGTGRSPWGFGCYNPVLFYGKPPNGGVPTGTSINLPAAVTKKEGEYENFHPCPKPLEFMRWAVATASTENETVLDPFMGSGTTGVACAALDRKFVGVEMDEKFFDLACRRITDIYAARGAIKVAPRKGFIY